MRLRAALLAFACALPAAAQTNAPQILGPAPAAPAEEPRPNEKPQGVYASIDIRHMEQQISALGQLIPSPRREAIAVAVANAAKLRPPVLYALANAVAQDDRNIADAVYWYHVARLRAVYDALRCRDASVRGMVNSLGQRLNPDIARWQRQHRPDTLAIAQRAMKWDSDNLHDYDHRWINMYGKVARYSEGKDPAELSAPEAEWPAILERVHAAHLKSVQEFASQKP